MLFILIVSIGITCVSASQVNEYAMSETPVLEVNQHTDMQLHEDSSINEVAED